MKVEIRYLFYFSDLTHAIGHIRAVSGEFVAGSGNGVVPWDHAGVCSGHSVDTCPDLLGNHGANHASHGGHLHLLWGCEIVWRTTMRVDGCITT